MITIFTKNIYKHIHRILRATTIEQPFQYNYNSDGQEEKNIRQKLHGDEKIYY